MGDMTHLLYKQVIVEDCGLDTLQWLLFCLEPGINKQSIFVSFKLDKSD